MVMNLMGFIPKAESLNRRRWKQFKCPHTGRINKQRLLQIQKKDHHAGVRKKSTMHIMYIYIYVAVALLYHGGSPLLQKLLQNY